MDIINILTSGFFGSAAGLTVLWFGKNMLSERLQNAIKHEYDAKLSVIDNKLKLQSDLQMTQLKAAIEKESEKIRFAAASMSESQKIIIVRRLDGLDVIWKNVIDTRMQLPGVLTLLDHIPIELYNDVTSNRDFISLANDLSIEKINQIFSLTAGPLELQRPYVGEYLWMLFQSYRSFLLQICLKIEFAKKEKTIPIWHQDPMLLQFIQSSMEEDEYIEMQAMTTGKMGWIQRKYESKILSAISVIMSGREFGEEALQQIESMEKAIESSKTKSETLGT